MVMVRNVGPGTRMVVIAVSNREMGRVVFSRIRMVGYKTKKQNKKIVVSDTRMVGIVFSGIRSARITLPKICCSERSARYPVTVVRLARADLFWSVP